MERGGEAYYSPLLFSSTCPLQRLLFPEKEITIMVFHTHFPKGHFQHDASSALKVFLESPVCKSM